MKDSNAAITLAVLAGGMSTRMGAPKSGITLDGDAILRYLAKRLRWPGPTLLVTAPSNRNPDGADTFDQEVTDPFDGGGPAQGLLTALSHTTTQRLIMLAVDMPLIGREQLLELCQTDGECVLCRRQIEGQEQIEPFPGLFGCSLMDPLRELLSQNRRSLHGLLKLPGASTFDATHWSAESWTNLNTPQDLARFKP